MNNNKQIFKERKLNGKKVPIHLSNEYGFLH